MSSSDDDSEVSYNASNYPSEDPGINHSDEDDAAELEALLRLMSFERERGRICDPDLWPRATIMTPRLMAVLSEYDNIWDNLSDTFLYYKTYVQEQYKKWLVYQTPQAREALQLLRWPSKGFIVLSAKQRIDSFSKAHERLGYLVRSFDSGLMRYPAVTSVEFRDALSWIEYIRQKHVSWLADRNASGRWREEFITCAEAERKRVLLSDPPTAVMNALSQYDDLWSDYEGSIPSYSQHNRLQQEGWRNREKQLRSQAERVPQDRTPADTVPGAPNRHKQPHRRPGPMTTTEYPIIPPRQPVYYLGFDTSEGAKVADTTPARPSAADSSLTESVASSKLAINDRASNDSSSNEVQDAHGDTSAPLSTAQYTSSQNHSHSRPLESFVHKTASSPVESPQLPLGDDTCSQHAFHKRKESHTRDLEAKLTALKDYTDALQSDHDRLKQALQRARTDNEILRSTRATDSQEHTFMDHIHGLKYSDDQEILYWLRVVRGRSPQEHTAGVIGPAASTG